jgi:A/G-specific adenine glycosylase
MHALGPIRALRPRLQRLTATLVKRRTPIAAEPRDPPRDIALRPPRVFLSRQIPIAVARSRRPRPHLVAMAVPPAKAPSPKRVNGDKSPKATKAKAKAPTRSPTEDIEDLIGKHPSLASIRDDAPRLRDELLAWYDKSHRILPWRRNFQSRHAPPPPGPRGDGCEPKEYWAGCDERGAPADIPRDQYAYGVWVSEIMSQQTQIERVARYWLRWTERWPDASALASATREEVNEAWAGLGYYRRAGFLLDGARHVTSSGGGFPNDAKGLASVPGVGPYTAAAIASIAFDEPVAAVDGNVIRVCTRLAAVTGGGDAAKPSSDAAKAVRACADWLISSTRPGDFNQAMMELGATVCTPKAPACGTCPLRSGCAGAALELAGGGFKVTDLPEKEKKPEKREERVAVRVVERKGGRDGDPGPPPSESSFLLVRRPEGGLLGGLWEFPSATTTSEPSDSAFYASCANVVDACAGGGTAGSSGKVRVSRVDLGEVTHTFSHVRHTYVAQHEVWEMSDDDSAPSTRGDTAGGREWRWVTATELETLGLSSGVRKIYELLTKREKAKKAPRESAIGKLFAKKAKPGE